MKKLILKNALAILLLFATGISFTGCSTPPTRVATEIAGTQVVTVDAAMKAWADYVRAGHATQAQVDRVHALYDKYYAAALVEQAALVAYAADNIAGKPAYDAALSAVAAFSSDLITLVQSFIK